MANGVPLFIPGRGQQGFDINQFINTALRLKQFQSQQAREQLSQQALRQDISLFPIQEVTARQRLSNLEAAAAEQRELAPIRKMTLQQGQELAGLKLKALPSEQQRKIRKEETAEKVSKQRLRMLTAQEILAGERDVREAAKFKIGKEKSQLELEALRREAAKEEAQFAGEPGAATKVRDEMEEFFGIERPGAKEIGQMLQLFQSPEVAPFVEQSPELKKSRDFLMQQFGKLQEDVPVVLADGTTMNLSPSRAAGIIESRSRAARTQAEKAEKKAATTLKQFNVDQKKTKDLHALARQTIELRGVLDELGLTLGEVTLDRRSFEWNALPPEKRAAIIEYDRRVKSVNTQTNKLKPSEQDSLAQVIQWYDRTGVPTERIALDTAVLQEDIDKLKPLSLEELRFEVGRPGISGDERGLLETAINQRLEVQ